MAIKRFNVEVPDGVREYRSRYVDDIRLFLESGSECAEAAVPDGLNAKSVAVGYHLAIRRTPEFKSQLYVSRRGDRVYLRRFPGKEG
jgi:hypothetical protein